MQNRPPLSAKIFSEETDMSLKYQKRYEGTSVNRSHILGGPLQRDEALILKEKKEEQKKELQRYLKLQIEEKTRLKESEKQAWKNFEIFEVKNQENLSQIKPEEEKEKHSRSPELSYVNDPEEIDTPVAGSEVTIDNLDYLSNLCKELMSEQEKLKEKLQSQETEIKSLKIPKETTKPKTALIRTRTPVHRSKTPAVPTKNYKLKQQHELEKAKLAKIEEKLENARRKRLENSNQKPKRGVLKRRASQSNEDELVEPEEIKPTPTRIHSAIIKPAISNSPVIPKRKSNDSEIILGKNLDSASESFFIYPDAEGSFYFEESDRLTFDYETKGSGLGGTYDRVFEDEVPSSLAGFRKQEKPLVVNKSGFPGDIFRRPK